MRTRLIVLVVVVVAAIGVAGLFTRGVGFTARTKAWPLEETVMRGARAWATPTAIRRRSNPVALSDDVLKAGRDHWADHCATCHANDGSGDTPLGRSLYPPAPDMRGAWTQGMSDGELFYVIERGIPFTGMPAWGTGTPEGERASWTLVRFIRHLSALSPDDVSAMEALNPKSPADAKREADIDDFLSGKH